MHLASGTSRLNFGKTFYACIVLKKIFCNVISVCKAMVWQEYGGDVYDDEQSNISNCESDIDFSALSSDSSEDTAESTTDENVTYGTITCAGTYTTTCPGGRRPLGHIDHCGEIFQTCLSASTQHVGLWMLA